MIRLCRQIAEDWRIHGRDWTKPGFRAVATHRFGVWRMTIRFKVIRVPLSGIYQFLYRRSRNLYGIELPYTVRIGRRVVFEHQGGIVIHGATVIEDDCIIRQNCTLGLKNIDSPGAAPTLRRGVQLGAGAVILGKVEIGEGTIIGANAVVTKDVPGGKVAIGNPAQVRDIRS